jgi:hypothetical protein
MEKYVCLSYGVQVTGATWRAAQMMHVASSRRPCGDEANDGQVKATGYIEFFYPNFTVFIVLDPSGILVFWLGL